MSDTLTDETKKSIKKVATRIKNLESENERLRTINKEQQTNQTQLHNNVLLNIKEKTEKYQSQYNELNKMYEQLKKNCDNRDVKAKAYESANKSKYNNLNTKYKQLKMTCDNRDVKAKASVISEETFDGHRQQMLKQAEKHAPDATKEDKDAAAELVQKQRDYRNKMKKKKADALKNRKREWRGGGRKRKSRRTRRRKSRRTKRRKSIRTKRRKSRRKN
jgi:hypothetical protein